jgi:hypothetical protein
MPDMNQQEFESFVELKIRDITDLIVQRQAYDFESALLYLYESQLYNLLLKEETKLWHLSAEKLFDMLIYEKGHGKLIYPDYV